MSYMTVFEVGRTRLTVLFLILCVMMNIVQQIVAINELFYKVVNLFNKSTKLMTAYILQSPMNIKVIVWTTHPRIQID